MSLPVPVSRDVTGQAKGMLMHRFGVGIDAALGMLPTSSATNRSRPPRQ
ncbi:ANTAR domain-containing protein [Rhodococcus rhodochrous]|nr:ANTAR domain-containing protein [Rhodococcus rhodochrous]MCB8913449.1 ANTAR domain-containing protein [Rhodococcus rhodochrous]